MGVSLYLLVRQGFKLAVPGHSIIQGLFLLVKGVFFFIHFLLFQLVTLTKHCKAQQKRSATESLFHDPVD